MHHLMFIVRHKQVSSVVKAQKKPKTLEEIAESSQAAEDASQIQKAAEETTTAPVVEEVTPEGLTNEQSSQILFKKRDDLKAQINKENLILVKDYL